jgi:ubiquinone/menaquinone biosynthesis C-methylase UbiE
MDIVDLLKKEALLSQERAELYPDKARYSRPVKGYEHHLGLSMGSVLNRLKKRQDHPIIVLDVMCCGGNTVRELNRDYGVDAFGVDILYYPDYRSSECQDRFIIAPAEDMSMIPDQSIDLILNLNGYTEFGPSIYKSLSEALRVLSPGGELHSAPFSSKEELAGDLADFGYESPYAASCLEGYTAIEDYEKETGQILKYEATRRLLPFRNLAHSFFSSTREGLPMITRMSPVLHLEKAIN